MTSLAGVAFGQINYSLSLFVLFLSTVVEWKVSVGPSNLQSSLNPTVVLHIFVGSSCCNGEARKYRQWKQTDRNDQLLILSFLFSLYGMSGIFSIIPLFRPYSRRNSIKVATISMIDLGARIGRRKMSDSRVAGMSNISKKKKLNR